MSKASQIAALTNALRVGGYLNAQQLALIAQSTNLGGAVNLAAQMTGLPTFTIQNMVAEDDDAPVPAPATSPFGLDMAGIRRGEVRPPTSQPASLPPGASGVDENGLPIYDPAMMAAFFGTEEEEEGFAGGFPEEYRPLSPVQVRVPMLGQGRVGNFSVEAWGPAPNYLEFDAWRLFGGKSPEYINEVKSALIAAGIIDEDQAGPMGHWRQEDSRTMYAIMAEANASGKTWTEIVAQYAAAFEPEEKAKSWRAANPFISPVFKAPDYASLSQAVRTAFGQQLGRDPQDSEMALLADQLRADFNSQHAATVAAARAQYEATARGVETESSQSSGTVQDVDPLARMEESILSRYGGEIERVEATQQNEVNVGLMLRNLAGMERAVG